ncbi:HNH endonuclease [uncultured Cohaesibacter sp.]|uniref:HNH endonuclease n=1 Tax=uncultured Cohaesibacter sp. TaxID=1002546 RepID=UPI0029C923CA|nr:HNH endonuclease [uncultured Cohaesibacter sp.]
MIETPQSFVTQQECDKAAFQNGFRRSHGEVEGWRCYSSTTAHGLIWLAYEAAGNWLLALDHIGVVEELGLTQVDAIGPGRVRVRLPSITDLYLTLPRVYELAVSLPDAPYEEFVKQTKDMPKTTEAERLLVQRVGQNIFRERLMKYWQGRCPLTGISDIALLRASHIVPWSECSTDRDRLDVYNGLLLSALWDAAFDRGLVSFDDEGQPILSPALTSEAAAELQSHQSIALNDKHRERLVWHRENRFVRVG